MSFTGNSASSRDLAHVLHPYTNLKKFETTGPLMITSGQGIRVTDEQGKEYIEGMGGLWCTSLGYGEERLVEAAAKQMRKMPFYHQFAGRGNEPAAELAEKLVAMAPVKMARAF